MTDFAEKRVLLGPAILAASLREKHSRAADREAEHMRAFQWDPSGRERYIPPRYDEPEKWTGILAFLWHDWRYRYHLDAEVDLGRHGKPHYCPSCGDGHAPGWQARLCRDHAWTEWGFDWCLDSARALTRGLPIPGPVATAGQALTGKRGAA